MTGFKQVLFLINLIGLIFRSQTLPSLASSRPGIEVPPQAVAAVAALVLLLQLPLLKVMRRAIPLLRNSSSKPAPLALMEQMTKVVLSMLLLTATIRMIWPLR